MVIQDITFGIADLELKLKVWVDLVLTLLCAQFL